jgi:ADP-heptose:LPS heptosyltransferase
MRKIYVPAGIGDSLWLMMKLINSGEKFDFILPGSEPRRGAQIFELLPQICNSVEYTRFYLPYNKIDRRNIVRKYNNFSEINEESFYLSANRHLEEGKRIEKFLPDLDTTYVMDYNTNKDDKDIASTVLLHDPLFHVGIYCSSYAGSKNWGTWTEREWFDLITLLNRRLGSEVEFVIIGAVWDLDLSTKLIELLKKNKITYSNVIGYSLGTTIEILKKLDYFIGFPSGLSIVNESLNKNGIMFYANQIKGIINTWASPDRIANGDIKECLFDEPIKIYKWMVDHKKI